MAQSLGEKVRDRFNALCTFIYLMLTQLSALVLAVCGRAAAINKAVENIGNSETTCEPSASGANSDDEWGETLNDDLAMGAVGFDPAIDKEWNEGSSKNSNISIAGVNSQPKPVQSLSSLTLLDADGRRARTNANNRHGFGSPHKQQVYGRPNEPGQSVRRGGFGLPPRSNITTSKSGFYGRSGFGAPRRGRGHGGSVFSQGPCERTPYDFFERSEPYSAPLPYYQCGFKRAIPRPGQFPNCSCQSQNDYGHGGRSYYDRYSGY